MKWYPIPLVFFLAIKVALSITNNNICITKKSITITTLNFYDIQRISLFHDHYIHSKTEYDVTQQRIYVAQHDWTLKSVKLKKVIILYEKIYVLRRKQNILLLLTLLFASSFDLQFHPQVALNVLSVNLGDL